MSAAGDEAVSTRESGANVTDDVERSRRSGVGYDWTPTWLAAVRGRPTHRRVLLVVATVVGLGFAWVHWLGLFVAGALVGLPNRTVTRALLAGVLFGVLVLVVQIVASPALGPGPFIGLTPLSYVTIGAALVAPVWGALVRAVV